MIDIKLYSFESEFDFGLYKGQKLKVIFDKTPSYINWCFQKIDWFCITDEIFNQLPIVILLKKENKLDNMKHQKNWLKILTSLHDQKKSKVNISINYVEPNYQKNYYDDNWLEDASGTNDPETMNDVFWNLD